MKSLTTDRFWDCYNDLPKNIQERAQKAYRLFSQNHKHPSLRFKKVMDQPEVYSVRITQAYRTLGVKSDDHIIWFWIGSHDDYEQLLKQM